MATAKTIACTNCAAPLTLQHRRAKTAVCSHCGAQLDLTTPDYAFLGIVQRDPITTPLKVGWKATDDDGTAWHIIGHIRFREDDWWWDEWLLQSDDGRSFWIQYDDGQFSFFLPKRLTEPIDPVKCTGKFQLGGEWHYSRDFGAAQIDRLDGELTWKARVGDTVRWIDAGKVAIEWTPREIEVFDVQPVSRGRIVELFGMTRARLDAGCYTFADEDDWEDHDDDEEDWEIPGIGKLGSVIFFLLVIALVMGMEMCSEDDGSTSSYHRGFGRSGGYSFGK